MKILVVNWRCIKNPEAGGAEVHLHEYFSRAVQAGHEITFVAHMFKGAAKQEIYDGIKFIRIGNRYTFHYNFMLWYKWNVKENDYDLVFDVISKIPLFTPTYVKQPLLAWMYHVHGKSLYYELPKLLAWYIIRREKAVPKIYKNVPMITGSESTKRELVEMGMPAENITIFNYGINLEPYKYIAVEKSEKPLLCYLGRIKKYKHVEKIIEALPIVMKTIPDITLEIGGTGDNVPELEKLVKKLNLTGKVKFLGFVTEKIKLETLKRATLFVTMPEKEGWGITVIEANAAGTPVIGSDVPGLRDSIQHKKTGILVPLNDIHFLAAIIVALLNDKEKLKELSKNAINWANNFSWDVSAKLFIEYCEKFLINCKK